MSPRARLGTYYFAYFTYAGAFVPYFPLWLAGQGLGAGEIAVVMAMPQAARIVAPAFWGWVADRTGAGGTIVHLAGLSLVAGYGALYAVDDFVGIALVMLILSVLAAGALPIVETLTLSALGGEAGRYGPIRLWGSVGFIVGVLALGGWLDRRPVAEVLDWVLALAAVSFFVSLALPRAPAQPRTGAPARLASVLGRAEVLAFLAAAFCMTVAHGALYAFYSLHLEAAGYAKAAIGGLWTLGVLAEIAVFLWLPQLFVRATLRSLLVASFLLAALRFVAIGWGVEVPLVIAAAQLLHAASFGVFHAASVATVHRLFPATLAASGQALYSSVGFGLGGTAGMLLAGWSWERHGAAASFGLGALFALAGALLIARRVHPPGR